ncbi:MAG: DUF1330 domain-containing protein, partial [Acidimicrobiia bacterium]|nr:DUF1330 domain-containing protein [Acidimicrobiia bacterium]
YLEPTEANAVALVRRNLTGPVTMLNLLRFREAADYSNHPDLAPAEPVSGAEAYRRYSEHTLPHLLASGGEVVFQAEGGPVFIGPDDERWDLVLAVRQRSVDDFFAFATNPAYLDGIGHRTAALEDSRLIPLVEIGDGGLTSTS